MSDAGKEHPQMAQIGTEGMRGLVYDLAMFVDLVGVPYPGIGVRGGMDCWQLAAEVLRRMGWWVPDHPARAVLDEHALAESVPASEPRRAGDVLVMRADDDGGHKLGVHVAVCLTGSVAIHATRHGSRLDRVSALMATGRVERVARMKCGAMPPGERLGGDKPRGDGPGEAGA